MSYSVGNHKVYLVGGAVRDKLLGIESQDNDYVVVGATPAEMLALGFQQVGADFPVFLHPVTGDEYALARTERKVGKGYTGFKVDANASITLEDDLRRRDLTINAMAMDEEGTLFDPFNGRSDLEDGVLRHTSEAFAEDPLRVLRLARFAARYDFKVSGETQDLCKLIVADGELDALTPERVWKELDRAVMEPHAHLFFRVLAQTGASETPFFKGAFGHSFWTMIAVILKACKYYHVSKEGRLGMIFNPEYADEGKAETTVAWAAQQRENIVHGIGHHKPSPERLYHLLVGARMFQASPKVELFFELLRVSQAVGMIYNGSYDLIVEAHRRAQLVTGAQFPHLAGKAVGDAIRDARINAIKGATDGTTSIDEGHRADEGRGG